MTDYEKIKVVLVGEASVGKTSIIQRYSDNFFTENGSSTIGLSYISKKLTVNKRTFRLDIWDTAGQERYRALTKVFFVDSQICIFVFDITKKETFEDIQNFWIKQLENVTNKNMVIGLVGNKSDLSENETTNDSEIIEYAETINAQYFKVSALSGVGINELFEDLTKKYSEKQKQKQIENEKLKIVKNNNNKKKFC
jgi:Ras-related protein Rab-21